METATTTEASQLDPWRDFTSEEQRSLRQLLRLAKDRPGKHFDLTVRRDGQLQVAEVERRVIIGRG